MISLISNIYKRMFGKNEPNKPELNVVGDVAFTPIGEGISMSEPVKICRKILQNYHLDPQAHALGTDIHGPISKVTEALGKCQQALHDSGIRRVHMELKLNSRTDKEQSHHSMSG